MPKIAHSSREMISGMMPELKPELFVFASTRDSRRLADLTPDAIATFAETEGMSLVLHAEKAEQSGFSVDQPMRCITLNVYSSLEGVGLTAAVATALGNKNIPCNMIAACHHDHVFVPSDKADQAMEVLKALQENAESHSI